MAVTNEKIKSLRLTRFETKRLTWALALSLAAHFLVWGGYELGKKTGLWQRIHWPTRTHLAEKKKIPPPVQDSDPSIYLDVDPDQVTPDVPKNTKYYSAKNSRAAQTEASHEANQPKLNGKQTDIPKTKDIPHTPNTKVQPAPATQPSPEKLAAMKAMLQAGDLKLAQLETSPEKNDSKPERPRTLNEARAQQQQAARPQIQMQQDGGTRRTALQAAFDAKATPFGAYDQQMFGAIEQYWDDQLYSRNFSWDRTGRVTLRFRLNYDGSVSDMEVLYNDVGELLCYVCQQSVAVPAPFAKWPSDMRRMIGDNYRQITLTFNYY